MSSNNSSPDLTKQRLTDLRNGLLGLHKTLLDSERATYERDIARIGSSGELLKLVLYDPWFAWLHELSEFVVLIDETLDALDETLDAGELPGIDAERLIAQAGNYSRRTRRASDLPSDILKPCSAIRTWCWPTPGCAKFCRTLNRRQSSSVTRPCGSGLRPK